MKPTKALFILAVCLPTSGMAQMTLDWQFSTSANPASPTTSVNPLGLPATASIVLSGPELGTGYTGGSYDPSSGFYGTPSGIWDTSGQFQLSVQAQPATPSDFLDYTLQIDQFVGDPFFNSGAMVLSPAGASDRVRTTITGTGANPTIGNWVRDTYTWHISPSSGPLTLTITPDNTASSGILLVDRMQWSITGNLTAVPEPALLSTAAAAGLACFAVWRARRRQA